MNADDNRRAAAVAPPQWAEAVLRLLLRPDDAETVAGDLIEEYRETVHPARGRRRADLWYVGQVIGFMLRTGVVIFGIVLAACGIGRMLLDTFAPPADYSWKARSAFTTWSSITIYLVSAGWAAWRTGRAGSGPLVALVTHVIGWTLAVAFDAVLFVSVIRYNPRMLDLFEITGGWGEEWGVPLMLLPVVLVLGMLGGLAGKSLGTGRTRIAA
jgi:hypothetical protein